MDKTTFSIEEIEELLASERIPLHYSEMGSDTPEKAKQTILNMYVALNPDLVAKAAPIIRQLIAQVQEMEAGAEYLMKGGMDNL